MAMVKKWEMYFFFLLMMLKWHTTVSSIMPGMGYVSYSVFIVTVKNLLSLTLFLSPSLFHVGVEETSIFRGKCRKHVNTNSYFINYDNANANVWI